LAARTQQESLPPPHAPSPSGPTHLVLTEYRAEITTAGESLISATQRQRIMTCASRYLESRGTGQVATRQRRLLLLIVYDCFTSYLIGTAECTKLRRARSSEESLELSRRDNRANNRTPKGHLTAPSSALHWFARERHAAGRSPTKSHLQPYSWLAWSVRTPLPDHRATVKSDVIAHRMISTNPPTKQRRSE